MPFMIHDLKAYFDAQFIQAGKCSAMDKDGKIVTVTFAESYDENQITGMINKFVNSPATRFDEISTPPDMDGNTHKLMVTGRFNKDDTTFSRPATYTDILYIVACRMVENKHVFITRYPIDNQNGQNPYRIIVSSTIKTVPVTIGETVKQLF